MTHNGSRTGKREPCSAITPLPSLAMPVTFPCGGPDFRLAGAHQATYPDAPPKWRRPAFPADPIFATDLVKHPVVRARLARDRRLANSQRQRFESASRAADFHLEMSGWRFQSDRSPGTAGRSDINQKKPVASRGQKVLKTVPIAMNAARSLRSARLDDLLLLQGE